MPRLYYPVSEIEDNKIPITGDKARYLISVLRVKKGDELTIFDGKGKCFRTRIEKAGRKEVIAKVIETFFDDTESSSHIILIQGLLKGDKMDLVIQRTTELGVKEIIPALTKRSQLKETRKVNRWRKIAAEASRQSGRNVIPVVHEPIDFKNIFAVNSSLEKLQGFIFYEEGGMSLSKAVQQKMMKDAGFRMHDIGRNKITQKNELQDESSPIHIFIGPEGGFTSEEIEFAKEKGLFIVSFGKRILRAETAAISAVTLVQFLLGDMC
jgi:16S rRNA (uracil1498-N3)-methyltransferase